MRRNFAEVLRSTGVDVGCEYRSLHSRVFERYGLYSFMESHFEYVRFSDTTVSLRDFNKRFGFDFEKIQESAELDDLLSLSEYAYNFAFDLMPYCQANPNFCVGVIGHVGKLMDKLHYVASEVDGLTVFVSRNPDIEAAAEVAPDDAGVDLIRYDYRRYERDVDAKRAILLRLIKELEPNRKKLEAIAGGPTKDLFFLANNLGIRHNNTDPRDAAKYKVAVAEMDERELIRWYDLCRDLCAASFLMLACDESRDDLHALKGRVANRSEHGEQNELENSATL